MTLRIVQLGTSRAAGEGLRLGTVRRPPRGVRKSDFAKRDYYDVWLPNLSPTAELVAEALKVAPGPEGDKAWAQFRRKFSAEMNQPDASRLLDLLVALSHQTSFSLGCYCDDARRCHRSVLGELLRARGASIDPATRGPP